MGLKIDGELRTFAWLADHAAEAIDVSIWGLPGVAKLPPLPRVTSLWLCEANSLTAIPALPKATVLRIGDCPALTKMPKVLPAAERFRIWNCPRLAALPSLPAAGEGRMDVWVERCPGLATNAGSTRGSQFVAVLIRGEWRIAAACHVLMVDQARRYWREGGGNYKPDCLELVEKLAVEIEKLTSI
ncbi:MAG TPA: hypothetical protein VHW66_09390 [Stellaceae bacterium]|jgi:hypothetical protein|nr:hypothetical protein [Stellaceae bacterium]